MILTEKKLKELGISKDDPIYPLLSFQSELSEGSFSKIKETFEGFDSESLKKNTQTLAGVGKKLEEYTEKVRKNNHIVVLSAVITLLLSIGINFGLNKFFFVNPLSERLLVVEDKGGSKSYYLDVSESKRVEENNGVLKIIF